MNNKEKKYQDLLDLIDSSKQQEATFILDSLLSESSDSLIAEDSITIKHVKQDLPSALENLAYILEETKNASDKTLSSSETILELIELSESKVTDILVLESLQNVKSEAINIMMAQSFQDLTGQVLNKVSLLVKELEVSLGELTERSGIDINAIQIVKSDKEKREEEMKGVGPSVNKLSQSDSVSSQENIDDLLGDLGI